MPHVILKSDLNETFTEIFSLFPSGFPVTSTEPTVLLTTDAIVELFSDAEALRMQLGLSPCSFSDYLQVSRISTCFALDVAALNPEQSFALYNFYSTKIWPEHNDWFTKSANPLSWIRLPAELVERVIP